jgi:hypothetical protein
MHGNPLNELLTLMLCRSQPEIHNCRGVSTGVANLSSSEEAFVSGLVALGASLNFLI